MVTENSVLMSRAKESLTGRWGVPALVSFVFIAISAGVGFVPWAGAVGSLVIGGPLLLGYATFIIAWMRRNPDAKLEMLFSGFNFFANSLVAYLMMALFTFLWTLLLIVPGIMAAYSYSMTFYILAENPSMDGLAAIKASKAMMYGHRGRLFCLHFRFIGWWVLCILTAGIAAIWVSPYVATATAMFYEDIKPKTDDPARPIWSNDTTATGLSQQGGAPV